jgi:hypothetical protein
MHVATTNSQHSVKIRPARLDLLEDSLLIHENLLIGSLQDLHQLKELSLGSKALWDATKKKRGFPRMV